MTWDCVPDADDSFLHLNKIGSLFRFVILYHDVYVTSYFLDLKFYLYETGTWHMGLDAD